MWQIESPINPYVIFSRTVKAIIISSIFGIRCPHQIRTGTSDNCTSHQRDHRVPWCPPARRPRPAKRRRPLLLHAHGGAAREGCRGSLRLWANLTQFRQRYTLWRVRYGLALAASLTAMQWVDGPAHDEPGGRGRWTHWRCTKVSSSTTPGHPTY